jgi:hypothetical protein
MPTEIIRIQARWPERTKKFSACGRRLRGRGAAPPCTPRLRWQGPPFKRGASGYALHLTRDPGAAQDLLPIAAPVGQHHGPRTSSASTTATPRCSPTSSRSDPSARPCHSACFRALPTGSPRGGRHRPPRPACPTALPATRKPRPPDFTTTALASRHSSASTSHRTTSDTQHHLPPCHASSRQPTNASAVVATKPVPRTSVSRRPEVRLAHTNYGSLMDTHYRYCIAHTNSLNSANLGPLSIKIAINIKGPNVANPKSLSIAISRSYLRQGRAESISLAARSVLMIFTLCLDSRP